MFIDDFILNKVFSNFSSEGNYVLTTGMHLQRICRRSNTDNQDSQAAIKVVNQSII